MGVILDAWKAWQDSLANDLLFGEAKKKHTRYMDLRARLKRQPVTDAERKVVVAADLRSELYALPFVVAAYGPTNVWAYNRFTRKVQNRFLRVVARQPFRVIVLYAIPATFAWAYARAEIADKFFAWDSGIVQLAEKYPPVVSSEGAKSDEAADGFIYRLDRTSDGATSRGTGY